MIEYRTGSIFSSGAQILVNPVNCVGIMGCGLAEQFKHRYPDMYADYRDLCRKGQLVTGQLWLWQRRVLCFPTKMEFTKPSELDYIRRGLIKFEWALSNIWGNKYKTFAFPKLGCGMGSLKWKDVKPVMETFLKPLPVTCLVYE